MIERGRRPAPETAASRRKLAFRVRETRVKLTTSSSAVNRTFDVEMLRLYAQSQLGAAPALVGLDHAGQGITVLDRGAILAEGSPAVLTALQTTRDALTARAEVMLEQYWDQLRAHARLHYVEERDVDDVMELCAKSTGVGDLLWPLHGHGVAGPTKVTGDLFHPLERRIERPRPADVEVVLALGRPEVLDVLEQPLGVFVHAVLERRSTPRAVHRALGRCAVAVHHRVLEAGAAGEAGLRGEVEAAVGPLRQRALQARHVNEGDGQRIAIGVGVAVQFHIGVCQSVGLC